MKFFKWLERIRGVRHAPTQPIRRKPSRFTRPPRLGCEALEDRLAPAASLVGDINSGPPALSIVGPDHFTDVNGVLFFTATDAVHGTELWKSDGTAAGTVLVSDIWAGSSSSSPDQLTNVNGTLFFVANNGIDGRELWRSDGTAAGTVLVVKNLFDVSLGPNPPVFSGQNLTAVGSLLYLNASGDGTQLWKSDGTAAGTVLVKDISTAFVSTPPANLTNVNGTLYFTATDSTNGAELWKSDGTAAGTVIVKDIVAGSGSSSPSLLTNVNGTLYFSASDAANGAELWKSNGTAATTVLVRDIVTGSAGSSLAHFTSMNGSLYFRATTTANGDELWKSTGTSATTAMVLDIRAGTAGSGATGFKNVGGTLFFQANNGTSGAELWKSDGTAAGTALVKDIVAGSAGSSPTQITNVNGIAYFRTGTGGDYSLWKSDGSAAGTTLVREFHVGSYNLDELTSVNGRVFFHFGLFNDQLWTSDGSLAGTKVIGDFIPMTSTGSSSPTSVAKVGDRLFFYADDGIHGKELWVHDGGASVPRLVKEINSASPASDFTDVNGTLFFRVGHELWKSDGTQLGTTLVKDISPTGDLSPIFFVNVNGTLYFVASGVSGRQLWKSNGTAAGTVMIKSFTDTATGPLFRAGSRVFFASNVSPSGRELWTSDGTVAGTVMTKDINPSSASGLQIASSVTMANIGGTIFFPADDGQNGIELWKSDGSAAGTVLVANLFPDDLFLANSSSPANLTTVGNRVFFSAIDGVHGRDLWVTDGTAGGTRMVKDLPAASNTLSSFIDVNGTLFFVAAGGYELWKSDGTDAGTVLLKQFPVGRTEAIPKSLTSVDGTLYFLSNDGIHGTELWKSGGTPQGTVLAEDIIPGSGDGNPQSLTAVGKKLYFAATDVAHGAELWVLDTNVAPTLTGITRADPPGDSTTASAVTWTVSFSESVVGVDGSDFELVATGGVAASLVQVAGGSGVYSVTVSGITGNGTLALRFLNNGSIRDADDAPPTGGSALSPVYKIGNLTTVGGTVWNDLDGDGARETGEPGLPGQTVYVDFNDDGVRDENEFISSTDADGHYAFLLPAGSYVLRRLPQAGFAPSWPAPEPRAPSFAASRHVVAVASTPVDGLDFGNFANRILSFELTDRSVGENAGVLYVKATIDQPVGMPLSALVTVTGGSATQDRDYRLLEGSVSFEAGSTEGILRLEVIDDNRFEAAETVTLALASGPGLAVSGQNLFTLTITNNDATPRVSFASAGQTSEEGDTVAIGIKLSGESDLPVTATLAFTGSTATSGDYQIVDTATVTIPAGVRSVTKYLVITDDPTGETAETIRVSMTSIINATLSLAPQDIRTQAISIPINDQPTVSFSKSAETKSESIPSTAFDVRLSNPSTSDVTVPITLQDTAEAADYSIRIGTEAPLPANATSATVTIPAGATSKQVRITIVDDSIDEPNESVTITMGQVSGGAPGTTTTYELTIADNDTPIIEFKADNATEVWENGNSVTFTVTSSLVSEKTLIIPIKLDRIASGADTLGSDFTVSTDNLMIQPGETTASRTITIVNDADNEKHEKIVLSLRKPSATAGYKLGDNSTQTITILDNDPIVRIVPASESVSEAGGSTDFTFALDHATNQDVTVEFKLGGIADLGEDYSLQLSSQGITRKNGPGFYGAFHPTYFITIPAGAKSRTIQFDILDDAVDDGNPSIALHIESATGGAQLGTSNPWRMTTILDDEDAPTVRFAIGDFPIYESNTQKQLITVELSAASGRTVYVKPLFLGVGIHAYRDIDYVVSGLDTSGMVAIPAGSTSATFGVTMIDRAKYQGDRSFRIYIDWAFGAESEDNSVFIYIVDDEKPPQPAPTQSTVYNPGTLNIPGLGAGSTAPSSGGTTGSTSSAPTNTTTTTSTKDIHPGTLTIGIGSQGFLESAAVFFDGNFNGVQDFLDLNNDGIQDEGEPEEPSTQTDLDGSFVIFIPTEFDRDGSGLFDTDEGRWVVAGGLDSSTDLPWESRMYAPLGEFVITPLTSLVEQLVRSHDYSVADAETRVIDAFGLPPGDLGLMNPLAGMQDGDSVASQYFATHASLYSTVVQIANLFAGRSGNLPVDYFADLVYADVAAKIADPESNADLLSPALLADFIRGVSSVTGIEFASEDLAGAAAVIAAGNTAIANVPATEDAAQAIAISRVKKIFQGDAAAALREVGAGTESIAAVVANFTQPNVQSRIDAATLGNVFPSAIGIADALVHEGDAGTTTVVEFQVLIRGDHADTISVDYETQGGEASTGVDFEPVAGTLTWLPGDMQPKTIHVTVNGDSEFEQDELFRVLLSNGQNAVIRRAIGYSFILNDDAAQFTTSASPPSGANEFVAALSDLRATMSLSGQQVSDGTYYDPLTFTLTGQDSVADKLVLDLSANTYRADNVAFHGGHGPSTDSAEVRGGLFASIEHQLALAGDGQTVITPTGGSPAITFSWTGLESFLLAVDTVDQLIIEIPAGALAVLEDADPTDLVSPGMMQLRSPAGLFATTRFAIPEVSLRIKLNGVADHLTVGDLDPAFFAELIVDATPPTVTGASAPAPGTYVAGNALDFAISFDDHVTVSGAPQIRLDIGGEIRFADYVSGSGDTALVFRYVVQPGDIDSGGIAMISPILANGGAITGGYGADAGLAFSPPDTAQVAVDAEAPTVLGIAVPSAGNYVAGQPLEFSVTFSEAVTVAGVPRLALTIGTSNVSADWTGESGTTLVFRYIVRAGDLDADGITVAASIDLHGGTIQDAAGNLAAVGVTPPDLANVRVDAVPAAIVSVTPPADGSYGIGSTLDFVVRFTEPVFASDVPTYQIQIGNNPYNAEFVSGNGSDTWTFRHIVLSGELDNDGITTVALSGAAGILDSAGNLSDVSFTPPDMSGVLVDGIAPAVTNVTGPGAGTYLIGQSLDFVFEFSEEITVSGSPLLDIDLGGSTRHAVLTGSDPRALVFSYIVTAGDLDTDGIVIGVIHPNGGTIRDRVGNDADLAASSPIATGVKVDGVAPEFASLSGPSAGVYAAGQVLDFTITMTEPVTVAGSPFIKLEIGATSVSVPLLQVDSTDLVFRYVVASGDFDNDGVAVASFHLNGASITDAGNASTLASFAPAHFAHVQIDAVERTVTTVIAPSLVTYDGLPHGAVASWVSTGTDGEGGALTVYYEGIGTTVYPRSTTAPVNAGAYKATARFHGDSHHHGSEGAANFTIAKATLTGDATTQDALNLAKQGKLAITVNNVSGLANGDTLAAVLSSVHYFLTITDQLGTRVYEFVPTTVTTSGRNITIAYSLKDSALSAALSAELADNTSAATAVNAGFLMESLNYTLTDANLTRLFSTVK